MVANAIKWARTVNVCQKNPVTGEIEVVSKLDEFLGFTVNRNQSGNEVISRTGDSRSAKVNEPLIGLTKEYETLKLKLKLKLKIHIPKPINLNQE